MAIHDGLVHAVSAMMAACSKHVSRAARRLRTHRSAAKLGGKAAPLGRRFSIIPFIGGKKKIAEEREEDDGSDGVWQRGILMGEKCQPLDFSGAIYYDRDGQRLPEVPKSPARSTLPSSFHFRPVVVQPEKTAVN